MCRECRDTGLWWCNGHDEAHPVEEFGPHASGQPGVYRSTCRAWQSERQWARRGKRTYRCESCDQDKAPADFPHVVRNYCVCTECLDAHPGERWCRDCGWRPLEMFRQSPSGEARNSRRVRCDPCYWAYLHNTTVADVLTAQGVDRPECAACGATEDLHIDHDHSCCPGERAKSCGKCVRGYLCRDHNVAEGILRTAKSARQLADYMARFETT